MDTTNNKLTLAINAAKTAGELIFQGYNKDYNISEKDNKSIVTEIDKKAEEVIISILEKENNHPILSEETRSSLPKSETYWAIDPLDGTTNFARKIPFCAVSIALIKDSKPVIGVVYNPFLEELYTSEEGKGAFFNKEKVSASTDNNLIFVNTGYLPEHKTEYAKVTSLATQDYTIRKMGSTAYELALIARGAADGFICWGDSLWDHAAGIALVREAGGIVTDWSGKEWTPETDYVLAGNKMIHPKLLQITATL